MNYIAKSRAMTWGVPLAVLLILGGLLIAQKPGLQYDEALLVSGGIHLTHATTEFPLEHAPHSWYCGLGPCFPLMAEGRYIGAIKELVTAPLFPIFGPRSWLIRGVSLAFAGIGIVGLTLLLGELVSKSLALVVGLVLAVNPTYLAMSTFDNGAVGVMFLALGCACAALAYYRRVGGVWAAACVGFAAGMGVWARANYVWFLAACVVAGIVVLRSKLLRRPWPEFAAVIGGSIAGAFPFLLYQWLSRGGTFEAVTLLQSQLTLREQLPSRIWMFAESLLIDVEHRMMWGNPEIADWQRWIFVSLVILSCIAAWIVPGKTAWVRFTRFCTITLVVLLAFMFSSSMSIAEHHLVLALPVAATLVCVTGWNIWMQWSRARVVVAALGVLYFASAIVWDVRFIQGLARTKGVGVWSDGIFRLAAELDRKQPTKPVKITAWGLQHNLFVLTDERVPLQELFWGATPQRTAVGTTWREEIAQGGIFVIPGNGVRQDLERVDATDAFLASLAETRPPVHVTSVLQANGDTYAQILEITPTVGSQTQSSPAPKVHNAIGAADNDFEQRTSGFFPLEDGRWRWAGGEFRARLDAPDGYGGAPHVVLHFSFPNTPPVSRDSVTVRAWVNGTALPGKTFGPGAQVYSVPVTSLEPRDNDVRFVVTPLVSAPGDQRELGVVVTDLALALR